MSEEKKPKQFVIIIMATLKVRGFDYKDDWETAMQALRKKDKPFIMLKYHHGAETYTIPEVLE